MFNYRVWAQSRRSPSSMWVAMISESIFFNYFDDKKVNTILQKTNQMFRNIFINKSMVTGANLRFSGICGISSFLIGFVFVEYDLFYTTTFIQKDSQISSYTPFHFSFTVLVRRKPTVDLAIRIKGIWF